MTKLNFLITFLSVENAIGPMINGESDGKIKPHSNVCPIILKISDSPLGFYGHCSNCAKI